MMGTVVELQPVVDVLLLSKKGNEVGEVNSSKGKSSRRSKHSITLVWDQPRTRGMN